MVAFGLHLFFKFLRILLLFTFKNITYWFIIGIVLLLFTSSYLLILFLYFITCLVFFLINNFLFNLLLLLLFLFLLDRWCQRLILLVRILRIIDGWSSILISYKVVASSKRLLIWIWGRTLRNILWWEKWIPICSWIIRHHRNWWAKRLIGRLGNHSLVLIDWVRTWQ